MFPKVNQESIRRILEESPNVDQAVNKILDLRPEESAPPPQRQAQIPQRRAQSPAFPSTGQYKKQFNPLSGHHLFLPSRLVSVEYNTDIFGTFDGPVDDDIENIPTSQGNDITKSYDSSQISPFTTMPLSVVHSTPIDKNTKCPLWNLSAIHSDHSWRCSFSSDA